MCPLYLQTSIDNTAAECYFYLNCGANRYESPGAAQRAETEVRNAARAQIRRKNPVCFKQSFIKDRWRFSMLRVGIMAHPQKKLFREKLPELLELFKRSGIRVFFSGDIMEKSPHHFPEIKILPARDIPAYCDMIFSFGGDGTMLRTIQVVGDRQTPVLGVNLGGLGFLTEVTLEDFTPTFRDILDGKYHLEERLILEGRIEGQEKPMHALNEITIEKGRSTRVIEVAVEIDGKYFNDIVADGLIISTPTGSTGYSLSSNGPIVVPTSECLILNPICPHSLTNRPVIIPAHSKISAHVFTDYPEIVISADNQDVREIPSRTKLEIQVAPFRARLVKHPASDYFSLLRNKLNWGGDFRNKLRWSFKS